MRLTRAGEYAVRCMLYLSCLGVNKIGSRMEISQSMDIPAQFLSKIAQKLGRAGYIEIVQGPKGGFRLIVPPEKITLLGVVEAVIGEIYLNDCLMRPESCYRSPTCTVYQVWKKARRQLRQTLEETTFASLHTESSCFDFLGQKMETEGDVVDKLDFSIYQQGNPNKIAEGAMPRRARLDTPGTLHHVIVRGIEKRRIVNDDQDRNMFVERIADLSRRLDTAVYAWALLTDHAHILLRSGPQGISAFMRKLLTGYAGTYNRRHRRHGHLFQDRYKSIVVEEDAYFKELVRYIHLNPLRAGMAKSIKDLEGYPWSGHSALLGKVDNDWQDKAYVLKWFGDSLNQARQSYRRFVRQGISLGRQPHLAGGGPARPTGGLAEIKALQRIGRREKSDERILGTGSFVEKVLSEAESAKKDRLAKMDRERLASELIESCCRQSGVSIQALSGGSRLGPVSRVRRELASRLTAELGLSLAETARHLGVSTSGVAKILVRRNHP